MKNKLASKLLSIILCGMMLAGVFTPVTAAAKSAATTFKLSDTFSVDDDMLPDSDELLEGYFQKQLYGDVSFYGTTAGSRLNETEKEIYNKLKNQLFTVASGSNASTEFSVTLDKMFSWTAQDLGVTAIIRDGALTPEAEAALNQEIASMLNLNLLLNALLADCPYELYWFDKTANNALELEYGFEGTSSLVSLKSFTFNFAVVEDYKGAGEYRVDTAKTSAASKAAEKAKAIVEEYADKTDIEKLNAYRAEICRLVSYDEASANDGTSYGDPWQLIYVFDGNPNTNVVCEGYAKAFQYLCDLSEFDGDVVCNTVTGIMNGGTGAGQHMWNVVEYGGRYYLADITNCDEKTIGADRKLFMVGTASSVDNIKYIFTIDSNEISYKYDSSLNGLICDGYPALCETSLSITDFSGACGENVTWSLDTDTGVLTISGSGNMNNFSYSNAAPWYSQKDSIKSVNIENGITSIGDNAFEYCLNVTSISVPDSIKSIGGAAFLGCRSLKSIIIPAGVTSIDYSTFSDCSSLTSIDIPDSVKSIGSGAFSKCISLKSITIPDGVKNIGGGAFEYCSSLTNITIPDGVTSIDDNVFRCCSNLTNITIPNTVTEICYFSFLGCENLESIAIPSSVKSIAGYAFEDCSGLTSVNIDEGVENIGYEAFLNCPLITSITIPKSVETIGEYAFGYTYDEYSEGYTKIPDFTITGYSDTAAAAYANENKFKFIPLDKETLIFENGDWYYFVNGQKVNATTLCNFADTWFYIENGKVNWDAKTLCNYNGDWFYVENGAVNWNATTLCNMYDTWFYVENGVLNWNARTLCYYGGNWFFVENGTVNWNATTLCFYDGNWLYVENGVLNLDATTLCNFADTWFYVENGAVNWNATTLCNYYGTWFYVENGVLNWNARTLCNYYGTWFYVENGTVNWNATTLCNYYGTWFYVVNGVLNWNARTLSNYYGTWFFVENGTVNWNARTLCYYGGNLFFVENGTVNWNANMLCMYNGNYYNIIGGVAVI